MAWCSLHGVVQPAWRGAARMAWRSPHGVVQQAWRGAARMVCRIGYAPDHTSAQPLPALPLSLPARGWHAINTDPQLPTWFIVHTSRTGEADVIHQLAHGAAGQVQPFASAAARCEPARTLQRPAHLLRVERPETEALSLRSELA